MSRIISLEEFNLDTTPQEILEDRNDKIDIEYPEEYENPPVYFGMADLKLNDTVFGTKEAAERYLKDQDYENKIIGVKFREVNPLMKEQKEREINEVEEKIKEKKEQYEEFNLEVHREINKLKKEKRELEKELDISFEEKIEKVEQKIEELKEQYNDFDLGMHREINKLRKEEKELLKKQEEATVIKWLTICSFRID